MPKPSADEIAGHITRDLDAMSAENVLRARTSETDRRDRLAAEARAALRDRIAIEAMSAIIAKHPRVTDRIEKGTIHPDAAAAAAYNYADAMLKAREEGEH
jgi:hypothetical protein